jgi:hypothetical protein
MTRDVTFSRIAYSQLVQGHSCKRPVRGREARHLGGSNFLLRPTPNESRKSESSRKATSGEDFTIDDLLRIIPSPGKRLQANDLMFSTNSQGKSDPSVLREYIRQHSGEWQFRFIILAVASECDKDD